MNPNTAGTNVIDYNTWEPSYTPVWPTSPPPQPPPQVWVSPAQFFTPNWELAAQKAYEAMEAYYRALTDALTNGSGGQGESSEPASVHQGLSDTEA